MPFLFVFARDCGLARNSKRPFVLPTPSLGFAESCLSRSRTSGPQYTRARERSPYGLTLSRWFKPFPRFYILDEIPVALCQFITFASQMMSLDILRRGFIVVFYAGRTASVKRIRAERSRLIGYHAEIRSSSRSRSSVRWPRRLVRCRFFSLLLGTAT